MREAVGAAMDEGPGAMPAAASHRRLVLSSAIALLALVFVAFTLVGSPGLGIGHFFYVPVALVALATRPLVGAAAGVAAAALYALGIVVHPALPPDEVLTLGTAIRLVTYSGTGALIGWFASDNRRLVRELQVLAERDSLTGLPNTRGFESAIQRRLDAGKRFALLIGDIDPLTGRDDRVEADSSDVVLRLADVLGRSLAPGDELARTADGEFAVLAAASSNEEAARLARRLEQVLASDGAIRFGWAVHPHEGQNALSLYRAAGERLYARKFAGIPLRRAATLPAAS